MKHMKMALAVLLCGLLALACGACNKECAHVYGEWETVTQVTCTADGRLERFCTKCGKVEISTVAATGHHFGDWTDGDGVRVRSCAVCGYTETMQQGGGTQGGGTQGGGTQGGGTQGGTQGGGTVDAVTAVYSSLDLYLNDCDKNGDDVYYRGSATKLSVVIGDGTRSPDYFCFHIPEYVSYIKFIGRLQGNPLRDTNFYVETRTSDLEVEFEDIVIESNRTMFVSETRNINLSLIMSGTKCSFQIIRVGANGSNASDSGSWFAELDGGGRGEDGVNAFVTYGRCTLSCRAASVAIVGGNAGNGGKGGSALGMNGHQGGNGGDGGNGGAAFVTETNNIVNVFVYGNSNVNIKGGSGGRGGERGGSDKGHYGNNGSDGNNGASGCKEPYTYR